jgi:hypothetical protein
MPSFRGRIDVRTLLALLMMSTMASAQFRATTATYVLKLPIGKSINGFYPLVQYTKPKISFRWPSNEHTIFVVEDMLAIVGAQNDILIGETKDISNAYALIDGEGNNARRMIIFDDHWFGVVANRGGQYRVILANAVGHHVCGHTLHQSFGSRWDKELEADRAAGAILRKAFDEHRTTGGDDVGLDDIVRTVRATTFGQPKTDPSGEMRLKAYVDGWEQGSECLEAHYIPIGCDQIMML